MFAMNTSRATPTPSDLSFVHTELCQLAGDLQKRKLELDSQQESISEFLDLQDRYQKSILQIDTYKKSEFHYKSQINDLVIKYDSEFKTQESENKRLSSTIKDLLSSLKLKKQTIQSLEQELLVKNSKITDLQTKLKRERLSKSKIPKQEDYFDSNQNSNISSTTNITEPETRSHHSHLLKILLQSQVDSTRSMSTFNSEILASDSLENLLECSSKLLSHTSIHYKVLLEFLIWLFKQNSVKDEKQLIATACLNELDKNQDALLYILFFLTCNSINLMTGILNSLNSKLDDRLNLHLIDEFCCNEGCNVILKFLKTWNKSPKFSLIASTVLVKCTRSRYFSLDLELVKNVANIVLPAHSTIHKKTSRDNGILVIMENLLVILVIVCNKGVEFEVEFKTRVLELEDKFSKLIEQIEDSVVLEKVEFCYLNARALLDFI